MQGGEQSKRPRIEEQEEQIVMWSGPSKPRRSPVVYNEKIFVSEPAYRLPTRSRQMNIAERSIIISKSIHTKSKVGAEISKRGGGDEKHVQQQDPVPDASKKKSSGDECEVQIEEHVLERAASINKQKTECNVIQLLQRNRKSTHMPPRDPLCHVPVVTPPCPIKTVDTETPTELQTYTHVSCLLKTQNNGKLYIC